MALPVTVGKTTFNLRWCPSGSFMMGSPEGEEGHHANETQRQVTITKGFWMGETEVTQGLWSEVMGTNPSYNKAGDDYPVEMVSWNDCQKFISKLNDLAKGTGVRFALPTEAQWEYACRAGSTGRRGKLANGQEGALDDMGWHSANSGNHTWPVGGKTPNAWNLYDMHGNVWEWCANVYQSSPDGSEDNAAATRAAGDDRVLRGGSSWDIPQACRSANRDGVTLPQDESKQWDAETERRYREWVRVEIKRRTALIADLNQCLEFVGCKTDTPEEQAKIPAVKVHTERNPQYATRPGASTEDRIFLLSYQEAEAYFPTEYDRLCSATPYAQANGCYATSETGTSWWWLRTPGEKADSAAIATYVGLLHDTSVTDDRIGVQPCLWIELDP